MARQRHREVVRRTATQTRESQRPDMQVHADQESARGYQGLSRAAIAALGEVNKVASGVVQDRISRQGDMGALARMEKDLKGEEFNAETDLADKNRPYRRGALKADGAIRIRDWRTEVVKELASSEPGTDVDALLEARSAELLELPEFQDDEVRKAMMPALMKAQDEAKAAWQKIELDEIFTRQTESATEMARAAWLDGSLNTPEGREAFYQALNTEDFAYLNKRDVDKIIAKGAAEVLASGDVDVAEFIQSLEQERPDGSPGLMNGEHADALRQAAAHGAAERDRKFAEWQSEMLAGAEFSLRDRIRAGQYSRSFITDMADQVGLTGSKRQQFFRYWDNQNEKELRSKRQAAATKKAAYDMQEAILSGLSHAFGNTDMQKAATTAWQEAVLTGDVEKQRQVIQRFAADGTLIPQIKDQLSRTTIHSLSHDYNTYEMLVKLDPFLASRYTSDDTALLLDQHHRNLTVFGMSPRESMDTLPSGKDRGRRPEVSARVNEYSRDYFEDNPKSPKGVEWSDWERAEVQRRAVAMGLKHPEADMKAILAVSANRVAGDTHIINGLAVPRGSVREAQVPYLEQAAKTAGRNLHKEGKLDKSLRDTLSYAPDPYDPAGERLVLVLPNGLPVLNDERDADPVFRIVPQELSQAMHQSEQDAAEKKMRRRQEAKKWGGRAPVESSPLPDYLQIDTDSLGSGFNVEYPDYMN